jgi:hypothetical protein
MLLVPSNVTVIWQKSCFVFERYGFEITDSRPSIPTEAFAVSLFFQTNVGIKPQINLPSPLEFIIHYASCHLVQLVLSY